MVLLLSLPELETLSEFSSWFCMVWVWTCVYSSLILFYLKTVLKYACVHVYVCVRVYVCVHERGGGWETTYRSKDNLEVQVSIFTFHLVWDRALAACHWVDQLAYEYPGILLSLCRPLLSWMRTEPGNLCLLGQIPNLNLGFLYRSAGITDVLLLLALQGPGNLNLGLHICPATALSIKLSPRLLVSLWLTAPPPFFSKFIHLLSHHLKTLSKYFN